MWLCNFCTFAIRNIKDLFSYFKPDSPRFSCVSGDFPGVTPELWAYVVLYQGAAGQGSPRWQSWTGDTPRMGGVVASAHPVTWDCLRQQAEWGPSALGVEQGLLQGPSHQISSKGSSWGPPAPGGWCGSRTSCSRHHLLPGSASNAFQSLKSGSGVGARVRSLSPAGQG